METKLVTSEKIMTLINKANLGDTHTVSPQPERLVLKASKAESGLWQKQWCDFGGTNMPHDETLSLRPTEVQMNDAAVKSAESVEAQRVQQASLK